MRISHTETAIAFEGLVACAQCGTHKPAIRISRYQERIAKMVSLSRQNRYENFSFTIENCREGSLSRQNRYETK